MARGAEHIRIEMLGILLVFIGGAAGSMWRYWLSGVIAQRFGETFPFGTLAVNMLASGIIGALSGFLLHLTNATVATALQQFVSTGVCGGLSTFSSFSLQTWNLIVQGRWLAATVNILISTGFCLLGVAIGWQAVQSYL
jgi:fluoride exporter